LWSFLRRLFVKSRFAGLPAYINARARGPLRAA
jgi:hypothetical protein